MTRSPRSLGVVLGCLAVWGLWGCTEREPQAGPEGRRPPPPTVVSALTSGVVSRDGVVRVRFVNEEVDVAELGKPVASAFTFTPAIEGTAKWVDPRELEFRPTRPLAQRAHHVATLNLANLSLRSKPNEPTLGFEFSVMAQSFELSLGGLEPVDAAKPETQRLTGTVLTADVDDAAAVEKGLAFAEGSRPTLTWSHDADHKRHGFVAEGIARGQNDRQLEVTFDGAVIGVARKASASITVPGLNSFTAVSASAITEPERAIELRFSDPLKPGQRLDGLVKVGARKDVRFTVQGNVVRIFATGAWGATEQVTVETQVKNASGYPLKSKASFDVAFAPPKPAVRFATPGAILPSTQGLVVPVETMNLRAVSIEARQVFDSNIPQFLQVNTLGGGSELQRVGRRVWRKTVSLHLEPGQRNRWVRTGLDLTALVKANPAGLYTLQLSFDRPQAALECLGQLGDVPDGPQATDEDAPAEKRDTSAWDSAEDYAQSAGDDEESGGYGCWERRDDPCSRCFYRNTWGDSQQRVATRNVLLSDLGLLAKRGTDDSLVVVATDLRTAQPQPGVAIRVLDFQQQPLASGTTSADGSVRLAVEKKPYLVVAKKDAQQGYLRVDDSSALAVSHFDIGGAAVTKGLKGFLYGERGVWRPGDTLHLGFMLFDPTHRLPPNHPVKLDVTNARGQLVKRLTSAKGVNDVHVFEVPTSSDDPTGTWLARATVGGATFELPLKVESIMPNRLKIAFDVGVPQLVANASIPTRLSAAWLHGAPAKRLKADVRVSLFAAPTSFATFGDFAFDDPTRKYASEPETIFDGELDDGGQAPVTVNVKTAGDAPGMLRADFSTRVFEPGGAASVDRFSVPLSPYAEYVGVKLPKGDVARGMLLTDTKHEVKVVTLSADGKPVSGDVELKLFKAQWRWWWEKGDENADYVSASALQQLATATVHTVNGVGTWQLEVKYPDWGRYLVLARDLKSNHRTGKFVYIDWPGWAGRAQKDSAGGASVLQVATDKTEYVVGEPVTVTFPTPPKSRALVSLETGSRVLETAWVEGSGEQSRYQFTAAKAMTPNVYVTVTLLQPHLQTNNDLPLRLFGVAPVRVVDAATRLAPAIDAPAAFVPGETGHLVVSEAHGRAMTYTLAVVDEGLLDLTRFKTPDPWNTFYARESLGVKTYDVFDLVSGAGTLAPEKLLGIGGDGTNGPKEGAKANRFPPLVRFLGPFTLAAGQKKDHAIELPHYVGAVRAMVVASQDGAFGNAERSVFVKKPLMVLATLPRVLGPDEEVSVPVSVFALEPSITKVSLSATVEGPLTLTGAGEQTLTFSGVGDQTATFAVKVKPRLGVGAFTVRASSGAQKTEQRVEVQVRLPSLPVSEAVGVTLDPGQAWEQNVTLVGMAGTNRVTVEASRIPPLNLGVRLEYLMQYPHGCIEQTTSSVFPQLYLSKLVQLAPEREQRVAGNVNAGIERLRTFQTAEGGFSYWPGEPIANAWGSTYAGHFLLEAQRAGFAVPGFMLDAWKASQRAAARLGGGSDLEQAYRLYTLALAGAPELGAMNQLREKRPLGDEVRWRLAAAYALAGQPEAAGALAQGAAPRPREYRELDGTFGSTQRDLGMVLEALVVLKDSRASEVALEVSKGLSSSGWLSTQETAYSLVALARYGLGAKDAKINLSAKIDASEQLLSTGAPLIDRSVELGAAGPSAHVALKNAGEQVVFVRVIATGTPAPGKENGAQHELGLEVSYAGTDGSDVDVGHLAQGTDVVMTVVVTNRSATRRQLPQLALAQLVPSGWEIHNERLDPARLGGKANVATYRDLRDDRVYTYLGLKPGESRTYTLLVNASYVGRFYLPMQSVEAMYDASVSARVPGQWVEVTRT